MIKIEPLEQVELYDWRQFSRSERNAFFSEMARLRTLITASPPKDTFLDVQSFLHQNGFYLSDVVDDEDGKWIGTQRAAEVYSMRVSDTLPGIYIVGLIATLDSELPKDFASGNTIYTRS